MTFKEKFMVGIHAVLDADWFQTWPHFSPSCFPAPCNVTLLLLPELESISPPGPLNLGWTFDLFWPLDCNRSNSGPVPSPSLKCTLPLAFLEPVFQKQVGGGGRWWECVWSRDELRSSQPSQHRANTSAHHKCLSKPTKFSWAQPMRNSKW